MKDLTKEVLARDDLMWAYRLGELVGLFEVHGVEDVVAALKACKAYDGYGPEDWKLSKEMADNISDFDCQIKQLDFSRWQFAVRDYERALAEAKAAVACHHMQSARTCQLRTKKHGWTLEPHWRYWQMSMTSQLTVAIGCRKMQGML